MTDPLARRVRRIVHAATDRFAWRTARFVYELGRRPHRGQPAVGSELTGEIALTIPSASGTDIDHIPPIIFQTWKSRRSIPQNYRYWRQRFVDLNPGAQVVLWDDADNRAFLARRYP